ncbi:MAG TPA: hypothetical protein VH328_10970 [Burkholderiaceae bacterium]|nr:hypothetical protein [Burkholderiaceae bacterium]
MELHSGLSRELRLPKDKQVVDLRMGREEGLDARVRPEEFNTRIADEFAALGKALSPRPDGSPMAVVLKLRPVRGLPPHIQAEAVMNATRNLVALAAQEKRRPVCIMLDAQGSIRDELAKAMASEAEQQADLQRVFDMHPQTVQHLIDSSKNTAWPIDADEIKAFRVIAGLKIVKSLDNTARPSVQLSKAVQELAGDKVPLSLKTQAVSFMGKWKGLCKEDASFQDKFGWGETVSLWVGQDPEAQRSHFRSALARAIEKGNPFAGLETMSLCSRDASLLALLDDVQVQVGSHAKPELVNLSDAYARVAQAHAEGKDPNGFLRLRLAAAEAQAKSKIAEHLSGEEILGLSRNLDPALPFGRFLRELHNELTCEVACTHGDEKQEFIPGVHNLAANKTLKDGMTRSALADAFDSTGRVASHDAKKGVVSSNLSTYADGRDVRGLALGTSDKSSLIQPGQELGQDSFCIARHADGSLSVMVTDGLNDHKVESESRQVSALAKHAAQVLAQRLPLLVDEHDFRQFASGDRKTVVDRLRDVASIELERAHATAVNATARQLAETPPDRYSIWAASCVGFNLRPLPGDGALLTAVGIGDGMLISHDRRTNQWGTVVPAVRRELVKGAGAVSANPDMIGGPEKAPRVHLDVLSKEDVGHMTYFALTDGFVDGAARLGLVETTSEVGVDGKFSVLSLDSSRMGRYLSGTKDSTVDRMAACKRIAIEGVVEEFMEDLEAHVPDFESTGPSVPPPRNVGDDTTGVGGAARHLLKFATH